MRTRVQVGLVNLTISIDMISLNHTFIFFSCKRNRIVACVYKEASLESMDIINIVNSHLKVNEK